MKEKNQIDMDLSIVLPTYNHEKYIKKAIDGILQQKTSYSYEVWIGDDASSDKTQRILMDYKDNLPDNFHIILRNYNIGGKNNTYDLCKRTTGKYLAILEGDDYWINPLKVQKQVNFLEKHPEYIAVAHNVKVVDENNKPISNYKYPECKKSEYTLNDFKDGIYCGQTASIICKNYYKYNIFPIFNPTVPWAGDRTKNFLLAAYGAVYCFQEKWSAYRYVTNSGSSYSANFKKNATTEMYFLEYHKELYQFALDKIKTKESIMISECIYFHLYLAAIIKKKVKGVSLIKFFIQFSKAKYKIKCFKFMISKLLKFSKYV